MLDPGPDTKELTPTERVAVILWHIAILKEELTTAQVATLSGLSMRAARRMMCAISRKVPIYKDDGVWVLCK